MKNDQERYDPFQTLDGEKEFVVQTIYIDYLDLIILVIKEFLSRSRRRWRLYTTRNGWGIDIERMGSDDPVLDALETVLLVQPMLDTEKFENAKRQGK